MPSRRFSADPKAAFMCECGASLCDARVSISAADYEAGEGPVLAQGHSPDCEVGKCHCCGRPYRSKRQKRP